MPKIISLFFLLTFYLPVKAQKKAIHKIFDHQDGLQIEYIQDIVCDPDHFLWLSAGVNLSRLELFDQKIPVSLQRFDGVNCHTIPLPMEIVSIYDIYRREDYKFHLTTSKNLFLFHSFSTQLE
ncbi:MAG: hypothetical protein VW080_08060 [Flavobacteriaceae bacterium]